MRILAFESSCDENSAAVIHNGKVLSVCTRTQTVHQSYGGVVPELAGRSHLELVDGLATEALSRSGMSLSDVSLIAATVGPGLIGSLLVGVNYARGLALSLGIPFRGIHHLEAHLWSAELTHGKLPLPFLVLLVSGGHTILILVEDVRKYRVLGSTLDDALGEAYDKIGKLVGLTFPAGADVDRLASQGRSNRFDFPLAMLDNSFNFSFSGLKTSVVYKLRSLSHEDILSSRNDILASFQEAAVESVVRKVKHAVREYQPHAVVAAGGVAANSLLRKRMASLSEECGILCAFPSLSHCGDNAAMIGYLAWKLDDGGIRDMNWSYQVRPRWPVETLMEGTAAQ